MQSGNKSEGDYTLLLYISGATQRSKRAITNIKKICEEHINGRYNLKVVDIYQSPEQLAEYNIVAAPTLIKETPLPVRRLVGDLSDTARVLKGLALSAAA
jgi:circadian clock protein KaiB